MHTHTKKVFHPCLGILSFLEQKNEGEREREREKTYQLSGYWFKENCNDVGDPGNAVNQHHCYNIVVKERGTGSAEKVEH